MMEIVISHNGIRRWRIQERTLGEPDGAGVRPILSERGRGRFSNYEHAITRAFEIAEIRIGGGWM